MAARYGEVTRLMPYLEDGSAGNGNGINAKIAPVAAAKMFL